MHRLKFSLLCINILVGITTFTACDSQLTTTFLLVPEDSRQIHVAGSGSVVGKPDIAMLRLGVNVEKPTVAEAREAAAAAMTAVLDSLKSNSIAETDIQTQMFNISPAYDYNNGKRILRGYNVSNNVTAKIRALDNLSQIIDDAAGAGGDLAVINSIQFAIEDSSELATHARMLAVKDAEAKARTLAQGSGVTLGKPVSISEVTDTSGPSPIAYDEAASADLRQTATPIQAGELTVTVNITVVYEIE